MVKIEGIKDVWLRVKVTPPHSSGLALVVLREKGNGVDFVCVAPQMDISRKTKGIVKRIAGRFFKKRNFKTRKSNDFSSHSKRKFRR